MRIVTELHEMQELAIEIFTSFKSFCEQKDLKYYLACGTLIGAIRHNGFIPWDDDIDVWVPRKDFDRLCSLFPEWGEKNNLYINCPSQTKGYDRAFAQICLANTHLQMHGYKSAYNEGYFIDVFPIDGLPASRVMKWLRLTHLQILKNIGSMISYDTNMNTMPGIKGKILTCGHYIFGKMDSQKVMQRYETVARKSPIDKSDSVQIQYCNTGGRNLVLPYECFAEPEHHLFEKMDCTIPKGYDAVLKQIYGDYMTLPPIDSRAPHHSFDLEIDI